MKKSLIFRLLQVFDMKIATKDLWR